MGNRRILRLIPWIIWTPGLLNRANRNLGECHPTIQINRSFQATFRIESPEFLFFTTTFSEKHENSVPRISTGRTDRDGCPFPCNVIPRSSREGLSMFRKRGLLPKFAILFGRVRERVPSCLANHLLPIRRFFRPRALKYERAHRIAE